VSTSPTTSPLPAIELAQRTDPGRDPTKQQNEDAVGYRETRFGHLVVVCDGMGGHSGGQEASTAALATIFETFDRAPTDAIPRDVLRDAIMHANVRVRALGTDETPDGRPGSTVVAVLLHARGAEVAHAGDSRAYLIHEGQIFQLTRDHSMVQQMVDARMLTPAQAAVHPDANKITRALGIEDEVDVEVRAQPIAHVAGDAFILCTDGLSDLVESPEILQIASSEPPAQAAAKLVNLANARGGHDNITVLILRVRESAMGRATGVATTLVETIPQTLPPTPPVIPPAPMSAPAASSPARRLSRASTIAGLLLASVGVMIAIIVLFIHARERGGRSTQVSPAFSGPLPGAAATPGASGPAPSREVPPSPSSVISLTPQPLEHIPGARGEASDAEPPALPPLKAPSVRHSPRK
jgi:serine/threonine protein phosphatase PrpC